MQTVERPMRDVPRRPWLFVYLFLPRCCYLFVLTVCGALVALFYGWLSTANSPWRQLASVLGDSFGYPRFCECVRVVSGLSLFCFIVVCLVGLLLVAIFSGLSFFYQFLFFKYRAFFRSGLFVSIRGCLLCCVLDYFGYVFDCFFNVDFGFQGYHWSYMFI